MNCYSEKSVSVPEEENQREPSVFSAPFAEPDDDELPTPAGVDGTGFRRERRIQWVSMRRISRRGVVPL